MGGRLRGLLIGLLDEAEAQQQKMWSEENEGGSKREGGRDRDREVRTSSYHN